MKSGFILGFVGAVLASLVYVFLLSPSPAPDDPTEPVGRGPVAPVVDDRPVERAPAELTGSNATLPGAADREEVMTSAITTGAFDNALEGIVRSVDGDAIAGVELELIHGVTGDEFSALEAAVSAANGVQVPRWRSESAADGRFRFANLPPGEGFRLRAQHPDFTRTYKANFRLPETGVTTIEVLLDKGFLMRGTVVDDLTGEPVPGANLELVSVMSGLPGADQTDTKRAKTDSAGEYELRNIAGGRFSLTVEANDYARLTRHNIPLIGDPTVQEPTEISFRMLRGETMRGVVVDDSGEPIARARVEASSYGTAQLSNGLDLTDDRGRFEIENLLNSDYRVTASAKGFVQNTRTNVRLDTGSIELVLGSQGSVAGTAVIASSSEPLPAFRASARMVIPNSDALGRVAARGLFRDGEYRLEGLNAGRYIIEVEADGYAPSYSNEILVELGQTTEGIEVRAVMGGIIRGRVVSSATGEPLRGVVIRTLDNTFRSNPLTKAFGNHLPRSTTNRRVQTDAEGAFELRALAAGTYQLELTHRDHSTQWVRDIKVALDEIVEPADIEMSAGATVFGTVYDRSGAPLPGAKIHLNGLTVYPGQPRANDKGQYRLSNLPAGTWEISAQRTGLVNPLDSWPDVTTSQKIITVSDGEELERDLYIDS